MSRRSSRERAAELAYISLGSLVGSLFVFVVYTDPDSQGLPPIGYEAAAAAVFALLALALRRRWPVALAVVCHLGGIVSVAGIGFAAMAVFNLAVHRSWRVTGALATTHLLLIGALWRLDETTNPRDYWEGVLTVALLHIALVAIGLLVRSQRRLVLAAQERARQAEEGQRLRVEEARHHERERLAREMHDVLAHRISLLAVHAGALEYRGNLPEEEARAAKVIRQCAHDALEDLREVIGMLRDDPGDNGERPQPTLTDLPALIEQSRQAGAHVTLRDRIADPPAVPARVGRHAYRIVQEGLTNARKHAPGTHVRVTVEAVPGEGLTVEVANPLPVGGSPAGPTVLPGAGAGLIGLRERVGIVGGRLEHGRTPQGDFRLRAWLPLQP
ncbi:sensor histidine kinase [Thermomonospora echinospora]|uniref:sensor histidine kinase n=1 Tax=Thermomonospora echinospora TaxID=1992 RepID=UPI001F2718FD|nr:histidine kinase [Thermomonospora echinospora]